MNRHRRCSTNMTLTAPMAALAVPLLLLSVSAGAEIGLVTWLHPQADGRLSVESAAAGVEVRVATADGSAVESAEALKTAGWEWSGDGFWQTPRRAGGGKLLITASGLPAGTHQVYLRYFTQERLPGNPWWFILSRGLEGGQGPSQPDRIVAGTGGHDPKTVYDTHMGTVGTEEQPTTEVTLWVERYEWSEFARFGSVRIETEPSMQHSTTADATPANDRIRDALLGNGPQADGRAAYGVGVVSGTLKVRPKSFAALEGQALPATVNLTAARGEHESRQVIVYSPERHLTGVRLECSALVGEGGATIPADNVTFAPVGYCPYRLPHNEAVHGYWPDPILTFLKEFTIKRGDVQSLWYSVHVPRDAAPGLYRGSVTLTATDAPPRNLPVEVRVRGFTLPKRPRLRVVFGCGLQSSPFEMSYGINPTAIYGFDEGHLEQFAAWAEAGVTAINLGYIWGQQIDQQTKMPTEAQLDEWVAQIGKRYEAATKAGLRDACYLYMFDEAGPDWDPAMRVVSQRLRREFPGLLLLTTAHRAWYPDGAVKDGGGTIEDINGWCPMTPHYSYEAAAEARRRGRQVWWYTCNSPEKPFANVLMTNPAIDVRLLMGFMAFAYQSDGFLYYAAVGGNHYGHPGITEGPYTNWEIVDNAHDHLYQKGPEGFRTPLPSLRLEAVRDGLEDYDTLYEAYVCREDLQKAGLNTPALDALAAQLAPYFAPGNDLVGSLTSFTQDPAELEAVRAKLGDYIEGARELLEAREGTAGGAR